MSGIFIQKYYLLGDGGKGQSQGDRQIEKDPDILKFISNISTQFVKYAIRDVRSANVSRTQYAETMEEKKTNNFAHQKQYYVEALISFRMIGVIRVCARRVVHKQSVAMNIQRAGVLGNFVMQTLMERIKKLKRTILAALVEYILYDYDYWSCCRCYCWFCVWNKRKTRCCAV